MDVSSGESEAGTLPFDMTATIRNWKGPRSITSSSLVTYQFDFPHHARPELLRRWQTRLSARPRSSFGPIALFTVGAATNRLPRESGIRILSIPTKRPVNQGIRSIAGSCSSLNWPRLKITLGLTDESFHARTSISNSGSTSIAAKSSDQVVCRPDREVSRNNDQTDCTFSQAEKLRCHLRLLFGQLVARRYFTLRGIGFRSSAFSLRISLIRASC